MKAAIITKTAKGNQYAYFRNKNELSLSHPLLAYMVELHNNGVNLDQWKKNLESKGSTITFAECGTFKKNEIDYYYKKFRILEQNNYFPLGDEENKVDARIKPEAVKKSLANIKQVTFEVTDRCGLSCLYCAYGPLYRDYDRRENKLLAPASAKSLLNYLSGYWNSSSNISHDRNIYIGFYGGEPLQNISFIREIVGHVKRMKMQHNRFTFAITTNALLLEKNMDFLVENNFNLLISLDGDREGNSYRVLKNGEPAYPHIIRNVKALREKYPDYFKNKVNFNAVHHKKNTVEGLFTYFRENFGKVPVISEVSTYGIHPEKKEEFLKTYSNITRNMLQSGNYAELEQELFINLPAVRSMSIFIHHYGGCTFRDYPALVYPHKKAQNLPTGTCFPFSRKLFLTVNGKILPCETIGHSHALGYVDETRVELSPEGIADYYNRNFDEIRRMCRHCYKLKTCLECLFNMKFENGKPGCRNFYSYDQFSRFLSEHISYLESNPRLYTRIMKEVVVD